MVSIASILYIILAIVGLGFLIFIHELGHYFVARKVGMKVEAFSIGFGKPIYFWVRNGVRWQICWIPVGGYVKIAGMQKERGREPHEIPGGFFNKKPIDRIKVAIMGPLVNFAFAILAFGLLWALGGREKPFQEYTNRIGYVDPKSELYEKGVRPGDQIVKYDGQSYEGVKTLIYASIRDDDKSTLEGYKIDYYSQKKEFFDYSLKTYKGMGPAGKEGLLTIGVLMPARYLIYDRFGGKTENPLPEGSSLENSGIQYGDGIFWADGELLFSLPQLDNLINQSLAFITVQRGNEIIQTQVPRVKINELLLRNYEIGEVDDWSHEASLNHKVEDLYFLPYWINSQGVVERRAVFIDDEEREKAFERCVRCHYYTPLQSGDKIIAIAGVPVSNSYEILKNLQTRTSLIIVDRGEKVLTDISWKKADSHFDKQFYPRELQSIIASIGTPKQADTEHYAFLKPVKPKPLGEMAFTQELFAKETEKAKKRIEKIDNPEERARALQTLEKSKKRLALGIMLQDQEVRFNPNPLSLFASSLQEFWRTIVGLVSGAVSPKYMAGPIGIVQIFHHGWTNGGKEALFWMAFLSLNLGIFNLLPIPVLDGGHILFSVIEMVTRRPMKAKTMERLVIPFICLLIGLFIFVTYNDLSRLFSRFF